MAFIPNTSLRSVPSELWVEVYGLAEVYSPS